MQTLDITTIYIFGQKSGIFFSIEVSSIEDDLSLVNTISTSTITNRLVEITMVEAVDLGQPSLFHKTGMASTEAEDDGASTEAKGLRSRLDDLYLNFDPGNRDFHVIYDNKCVI